ncbi:helix-turn-helix domain-containing protein [Halalkalibacter sp. APA_J-10(15)]|uniref:helix-turn-helix domain-containing protein n=1 Tax=Halalkalibacter sp. APA_J-10(15) TaxID=2933805 RepID=UPI0027956EDE|nr:helix-turn-helix transcriptional regulator [Halalkalibacter sp. APA_J-10(15)]
MNARNEEMNAILSYIEDHLYEPVTLAQLANHISYSRYHFARMFKKETGLSPLYYVASLRLQKAKDLLLQTNLSVRDIGMEIGQQSLGTFTTRFTERVGVTPVQFRHSMKQVDEQLESLKQLENWEDTSQWSNPSLKVEGVIDSTHEFKGFVLVGLFAKPIPEGLPLYGTLLSRLGPFSFTNVRPGIYYLLATSIQWGMAAQDILLPHSTLRARVKQPIVISNDHMVQPQRMTLHPPLIDEPPIIISLPVLMNRFLQRK